MEALKNLIANVPDWLKKLDELNGQIEQRQIELAKLTEENKGSSPGDGGSGGPKSVRNKGSTESLKPRDEPEAHPLATPLQPDDANAAETAAAAAAGAAAAKASAEQPAPASPSDSQSPSTLQRQASQMRAAGQARARATLRKRQRTDSVISAEGAAPKYRTRTMIIVYYDSYVQSFFEELVKFVSAGRNMMRKAKMAAKVAQIKRLAELEMPNDDDEDAGDNAPNPPAPTITTTAAPSQPPPTTTTPTPPPILAEEHAIHYISARRAGPRAFMHLTSRNPRSSRGGGPGSTNGGGDVYDELDRNLEYVQSMCEHAAHQFLRDGDCAEEVANIQRRLAETKELADREMERVKREDPAALAKLEGGGGGGEDDGMRGRSYRPQSMRRDVVKSAGNATATTGVGSGGGGALTAAAAGPLEVDEGVEDVDAPPPKLVYKSTRLMR
ncbi:hypothetical protein N657DRAFT_568929 [Parathielavia appendiculata]|uniref:Uncharacterized protein n=1 Tax=Parathielavia appendiculata TaxID=2587402 RepID=A0AAN6U305_9PEZI|nr:hypothetical protein N657DRAFT_568929 [Parathielavia appendiculata]